jgi:hypothetical protein
MKYLVATSLALTLLLSPTVGYPQSPSPNPPKVSLTAAQTAKIDQIRQATRQQIQSLFTSQQRETYTSLRQRGIPAAQAIEMLNLSSSRRNQLRQILNQSRERLVEVLGQP